VGSGSCFFWPSLFGIPLVFGFIWRNSAATFSYVVRYVTDLLNGVLLHQKDRYIRTHGGPAEAFFDAAGGLALGVMIDRRPQPEEFLMLSQLPV
jgi:hypothetical protein